MKRIILILVLILFSCSKKEKTNSSFKKNVTENKDLDSNFRKIIIDYQTIYPVTNPRKNNIYIYVAAFYKEKRDTIFTITRTGSGIIENTKHIYGLYNDDELKNLIVADESKLGINQLKVYKKKLPDSLIWKSDVFPESITPVSKFKIVNKLPKFVRTDTVWNHWD